MTQRAELNGEDLYLDDLQVGQRFTTRSRVISGDEIKAFAAQFDPQPFHLDDAAAKSSIFGGLAASGWHTAAITMRLLVESGSHIAGGLVGTHGHITWLQPARPGDVLTVESEVLEVSPSTSKPDRGYVIMRSNTRNQRNEIVQAASFKLLAKRRHAPVSRTRKPQESAMNDTSTNTRNTAPGFWTRLKLVLEQCGESYEEILERRVRRLEVEVERLSRERPGNG